MPENPQNSHVLHPDMRLTDTQRQAINDAIHGLDADAPVYHAGWRASSGNSMERVDQHD